MKEDASVLVNQIYYHEFLLIILIGTCVICVILLKICRMKWTL